MSVIDGGVGSCGAEVPLQPVPDRGRNRLFFLSADVPYFLSHRLDLAMRAGSAGYDVALVAPGQEYRQTMAGYGIGFHPLPFERGGTGLMAALVTVYRIAVLYRRERPAMVHHIALKSVIFGSIAARLAGVKAVVNLLPGLGYVFHSQDLKAALIRILVRPALRFALGHGNTRLIVQNSADFETIVSSGFAKSSRVHLIHGSGVEPARYRGERGEDDNVPLVVLPARLLRDKGVVEFVSAARVLKEKGVAARFALVGSPDPANPASLTEREIAAWVAEGVVDAWGWQTDMPSVFARADIVCLPSYHEGVPKCLLEAGASGCGIVASDLPGCREIVIPGQTGWLVPVRNVDDLAAKLEEAILSPGMRRKFGNAARQRVRELFSMQRVLDETLAVYRELVPAGNPAPGKAGAGTEVRLAADGEPASQRDDGGGAPFPAGQAAGERCGENAEADLAR
ncbi:MAG: glycosyltransferase family 4 protein [Alphaproteobacteria bacterium]|nr:glycosyltransferase family 4 protein [Alphaproteobacteria bacterium]